MSDDGGDRLSGFRLLLQMFRESINLDVWDLNFFFSDPDAFEWSLIHLESPKNRFLKGFIPQLFHFFGRMVRHFSRLFYWKKELTKLDKPIVFFGSTKNQVDCLIPIFEKTQTLALIVDGTKNYSWNVLTLYAYLLSLIFFPWAIKDYFWSFGINRKGIKHNFANHWLTYGLYFVIRMLFRNKNFKFIMLANDHNMETRVINKAARDEGKITFYIQHASVTRVFPSLNVDYALLEGIDALGHYEAAGPSTAKVFLIGSPKFDKYLLDINKQKQLKSLGVCVNLLDQFDSVKSLLIALKANFPRLPVSLRIHPGQKNRKLWEELAEKQSIGYSDSLGEDVFTFLEKVDAIIAGNSNVHLDAVMLNVFPIYYDFSSDTNQLYYTFLKKGLCEVAFDENAVCELVSKLINEKPNIRIRAKNYCDTVNSKFDGHSSDLASGLIKEVLQSGNINFEKWEPVIASTLDAYRLPHYL